MSNAKDCEQYCSDNNCCVCRNREWYKLYEDYNQLKAELTRANCQIADDEILQCDMREAIEELKAENEELKEEIKKHNDDMFKNTPEKRFYCKGCTLPYISKKLKQTLTEIKEIAETAAKCMYATYSDDYTEGYSWLGSIILQKISECEVE